MIKLKNRRAQSILEYVILSTITLAAVGSMTFYISRALVVKARHMAEERNEANR